jgi:O-antigen ligase
MNIKDPHNQLFISSLFSFERLSKISFFLYLFFIFFGTSLPFQENLQDSESLTTSNPIRQTVFSIVYFLSLISLLPYLNKAFKIIKQEKFLAIFLIWSLLGMIWSNYPDITFKRWILIFGSYIVIISIFVHSVSTEDILKYFRIVLFIYIPLSVISILVIPGATQSYQGEFAWRGLADHKNGFGQIVLVSSLIYFFSLHNYESKFKRLDYLMLFTSLILLLGSRSSTSIITLFIIGIIVFFTGVKEKFFIHGIAKWFMYLLVIFLGTIFIGAIFLFPSILENLFNFIGKDPTFTGRTDLWADVISIVSSKIIWGVGYGAFWVPNSSQLNYIYQIYIWLPQQSHNGYIDITIETGLVGLSIFISMLIAYFHRNRKWKIDQFWKYFILAAIILNFQESSIFRTTSMTGILFMFSYMIQSFEIVKQKSALN